MAVLVDLEKVTVRRVDRTLFEGLSLAVSDGERVGIVGINGTGKSTLLQVIAGAQPPEEGVVRRARGARVGFLEQVPTLGGGTVAEALGAGWEAAAMLDRLGCRPSGEAPLASLSGGEAKRVALARILSEPAELLVLDEPTNHLDLGAVHWLERHLSSWRGALVLVSHDRHLLEAVTTRMVELDRGRCYVHEGGYDAYLAARAARDEQAATAEAVRQNLARRELAWLRRGAKARSRKPQARVEAARRLIGERPDAPARAGDLELGFATPRLGDKVLEGRALRYRYDDAPRDVLAGVDLVVGPGERLGLVGGNGTGKSTLLDLLAGRREPSGGSLERGTTVAVGYYDQQGVTLDPAARVRDLVAGPTRAPGTPEDTALMGRFWFAGELAFAPVGTLSGGERRRLQLLLVLAARPNVLLLDEPTNDLDLDTLRSLEDLLEAWPGALVVVSHDRAFLERTTDRLVALEADGTLAGVPGGLEGWLERLERGPGTPTGPRLDRSGAPGVPPARVRTPAGGGNGRRSASTLGHLLREAERFVGRLERRRDELVAAMALARGHQELSEAGSTLAAAQAALVEAEERWLALAEEAESRR